MAASRLGRGRLYACKLASESFNFSVDDRLEYPIDA